MVNAQMNSMTTFSPNDRVCYLLGAGFSAAVDGNYPTAYEFLRCKIPLYTRMPRSRGPTLNFVNYDSDERDLKGLLRRIKEQYGPLKSLNLEHVMTDLYVRGFGLGLGWERAVGLAGVPYTVQELQEDYRRLIEYIWVRLTYLEEYPDEHGLAGKFVKVLRRSDSVLTLNYDNVVERQLSCEDNAERLERLQEALARTKPGVPMFRGRAPGERGVFAKLHGSLDWLTCPNDGCANHPYIYPYSPAYGDRDSTQRFPGMQKGRCDACGRSPEPVIIPPITAKVFERFPKLSLMWSQAYEALRSAQRWVFVGVSFATNDFHLGALLRAASRDATYFEPGARHEGEICVVSEDDNQAADAAKRLFSGLAPKAQEYTRQDEHGIVLFRSLEEYLNKAEEVETREGRNE